MTIGEIFSYYNGGSDLRGKVLLDEELVQLYNALQDVIKSCKVFGPEFDMAVCYAVRHMISVESTIFHRGIQV